MKIAVSSSGTDLDTQVDPRFGRCQYFIIVDPDTLEFEALANEGLSASGGAGIAAAQMIAGKGITAALTGNCGPNAFKVLDSAGIKTMTGVAGSVRDAVADYKAGKYAASSAANAAPHAGMG